MTDVINVIAAARSMLSSTPVGWSALAGIDASLLARRPAPGEWSAIECLSHTVDTERSVFRARVSAILEGRDFAAFDPDAEGSGNAEVLSAPDLSAEFGQLRAASLVMLSGVTTGDLGLTARHAELGIVTMAELLNQWAAHDTMHLVQAQRALMQAFIPGSGPWRPYFVDHDVETKR